MSRPALCFDIRQYDEVTSTNDLVKQAAADGAPEGVAVCAKVQTAGYGRRGHRWESGEGSLYLSLLLRPPLAEVDVSTLPLAVALAVRRAVGSLLPPAAAGRIQVKWPNDVVVRATQGEGVVHPPDVCPSAVHPPAAFAKLCGISCELKAGAVCVGIGVNVRASAAGLGRAPRDTGRNRPTYISELVAEDACPAVDEVRDAVLRAFADVYGAWVEGGFAALRDDYLEGFALAGAKVRIDEATVCAAAGLAEAVTSAGPVDSASAATQAAPTTIDRCIVEGVTEDGRLLVRMDTSPEGVPVRAEVASGSITMEA